ncbi:MAG: sugar transferase [Pseudomonadota bacterium]
MSSEVENSLAEPAPYRRRGPNGLLKRGFDVVAASAMLVIFAPLMLAIAAMIWWVDGGRVVYRHERVGRNGTRFMCLKFRTMISNADEVLHDLLANDARARAEWEMGRKLKDDPRILRTVGHFLRRSSLDELPQIWNVLRGDMSIVGPRPVVRDELKLYGEWASLYLSVRPGLTGPWQVGGRSDTTYEHRVLLDVDYIRSWRLAHDLRIVALTALMLVRGKGAY